jgi:hypothetical protein
MGQNRETLLKGMAQYSLPPCTNLFRSAPFYIENIINIFDKKSYLNEEVNGTGPSPSVNISWGHIFSHVRPFYEWAVSNLDP